MPATQNTKNNNFPHKEQQLDIYPRMKIAWEEFKNSLKELQQCSGAKTLRKLHIKGRRN